MVASRGVIGLTDSEYETPVVAIVDDSALSATNKLAAAIDRAELWIGLRRRLKERKAADLRIVIKPELAGFAAGSPTATDPRLVEVNFGDWQGFTFAELKARYPDARRTRALDKWNFQPPGEGAESYQMLLERVKPWFDAIQRQTICVTHGGVMRALFRFVLGVAEDEAANLEIPQDRVLRLQGDRLEWLSQS